VTHMYDRVVPTHSAVIDPMYGPAVRRKRASPSWRMCSSCKRRKMRGRPKIPSVQLRAMRQNQRIILRDAILI
jgi:hypothetical protein